MPLDDQANAMIEIRVESMARTARGLLAADEANDPKAASHARILAGQAVALAKAWRDAQDA